MPKIVINLNPKNLAKFLLCNTALFYLIIFLIGYNLTDFKKLKNGFAVRNYYMRSNILYLIEGVEGKTNFDKNELIKITKYYETSSEYLEQGADVFGILGVCYYYLNDINKSIAALKKAIQLNPDFFWYHYDLATIYYNQKNYPEAITHFESAVRLQPSTTLQYIGESKKMYWPLFGGLSNILKLRTRLVKRYWTSYKTLTYLYLNQKQYTEALRYAIHSIDAKLDQKGEFYFLAGIAYYKLNKLDDAIYALNKSLEKNPDFADALYYLGLSLKNKGKKQSGDNIITRSNQLKLKTPQESIIDNTIFPQVF